MSKRLVPLLMLSAALAGCDNYVDSADFKKERSSREYREAMEEYQAGRLDVAGKKLKALCEKDPANSSARFQLACLLQDHDKDYLNAYCAFREYLAQQPTSEKSKLAEDRLAVCERELASILADRHGLNATGEQQRRIKSLKDDLAKGENERRNLEKDLEGLAIKFKALEEENARLVRLMKEESDGAESKLVADLAAAKALLDDNGGGVDLTEAKALLKDNEDLEASHSTDDIAAAKEMLDEEPPPEAPVIAQPKDAKENRRLVQEALRREKDEKARIAEEEAAKKIKRPDTYVVQEGDTLYKIAVKFYGTASAWRKIREVNKATVSNDGRIKKGQVLTLPPL